MPGHKGVSFLGFVSCDITEISGMDSLYSAKGIIRQSENIASELFGCPTFYSTEGSSQCIKAMAFLAIKYANSLGVKPLIASFRNAHSSFLSAAAILDFDILWLDTKYDNYLSSALSPEDFDKILSTMHEKPIALLITSPDYMGQICDIQGFANVCHKYNILLFVDNAHGAYLKFLPISQFPIDLGADIVCDSAHKTMPVLTGGAYLHLSPAVASLFESEIKPAMALFGSTSPSFLILQSLDINNSYLSEGYKDKLARSIEKVEEIKVKLRLFNFDVLRSEPLKIVINTAKYGYFGDDFADILANEEVICEYYDKNFVVFMFSTENKDSDFIRFINVVTKIQQRKSIYSSPPTVKNFERVLSLKETSLSEWEILNLDKCENKIFADLNIACPPAVSPIIGGERITADIIKLLSYYEISKCKIIKE